MKLGDNRNLAQVGSHAEIGNGGNHGDGGSDVVEDAVRPWFGEGHANEEDGRSHHDGANCPVPVGSMGSDLKVGTTTNPRCITVSAKNQTIKPVASIPLTFSALLTIFLAFDPSTTNE
jgi:hypothetical protein